VSHLLVEPLEHVLLRDHLEPVAVHFLPQVSVLAFLQLDERRHLSPEGVLAQTGQPLPEADQELLDLRLHKLGAAEVQGGGGGGNMESPKISKKLYFKKAKKKF